MRSVPCIECTGQTVSLAVSMFDQRRVSHNCSKGGMTDKRKGTTGSFTYQNDALVRGPAYEPSDLTSSFTAVQHERMGWMPTLPEVLRSPVAVKGASVDIAQEKADCEILEKMFPHTWNQSYVEFIPQADHSKHRNHPPIRVGVVLSGGQAPGGHNVISGIFDFLKASNPNSQLFGFLNGPHGVFTHQYTEISEDYMNQFRNQGGFNMICSGRHKIETEEQKEASLRICQKLDLHGLVIIGGDDSNTNGAILAEYFQAHKSPTRVIGVPKTIDGDLKNEVVEASFGFDTAVKVYSELIGNLMTDVATSQFRYHFVRLMGRSASNIALECALQTRPNMCFVGEEVKAEKRSLKSLVSEIVECVVARYEAGKNYGLILVPEGLIEFIPEVGVLISQINDILGEGPFDMAKLTPENRAVFESLPVSVSQDLLLERDPHGNVQVSRIATEKLLYMMVQAELEEKHPACAAKFIPTPHFFGYEGRCAMPSNFDANYCYALGHTAGALIDNNITACMAVIRNLHLPAEKWMPAGCPVMKMMNIERRKGKEVPVIKKYLVELDGPLFQSFKSARDAWKKADFYRNPGPIQFMGAAADVTNCTIVKPEAKDLLPSALPPSCHARYHFAKSEDQLSPLQRERLQFRPEINPILESPHVALERNNQIGSADQQTSSFVTRAFPLQCNKGRGRTYTVTASMKKSSETSHLRVGVVLCGQQTPGVANVVAGLVRRMAIPLSTDGTKGRGEVYGFKGIAGLLSGDYITLDQRDLALYTNQGGFEMLGRTEEAKEVMRKEEGMTKAVETCKRLRLDGLVMIGGQTTLTDAAILTETVLEHEEKFGTTDAPHTSIVAVPANQENNVKHPLVETCLGFDSTSKAFAALVGNLLTDAASATKYWYFVRLMGQTPSHIVLESALQTHPNFTVVSEKYSSEDETLQDVVQDIADVVCARAAAGKNFGTVLVPEGLIHHLPQLKQLITEVGAVFEQVMSANPENLPELEKELVHFDENTSKQYQAALTPWSLALLKTLPEFFREQLVRRTPSGRIELSEVGTEQLLSVLVAHEMKRRKQNGLYVGSFSPVCHYFGFQGRSTMPSNLDCCLGMAYGYLAGITVECGLTGYVNSMRGLCGPPSTWRPTAIPLSCLLKVMPGHEMKAYGRQVPMVPLAAVNLNGSAFKALKAVVDKWENGDCFCNPGPIQFTGASANVYNRTLHEESYNYLVMLKKMETLTRYITSTCRFGIDETTLQTSVISLEALKKIIEQGSRSAA